MCCFAVQSSRAGVLDWKKTHLPQSLLVLGGLALQTTLIWLVLYLTVGYIGLLDSDTPSWWGVFLASLGLPFQVKCEVFAWLPQLPALSEYWSCSVYLLLLLALALYVLALLTFAFAKFLFKTNVQT